MARKPKSDIIKTPRVRDPYKYEDTYPQLLIDHLSEGLSFESFGGVVGISHSTLHQWVLDHDEFAKAKAVGELKSLLFWERLGLAGIQGGVQGFQSTPYIYKMKCRFAKFGYRDDAPPQIIIRDRSDEAKNLLVLLEKTVSDKACQSTQLLVSPSHSAPLPSQSGLLGGSIAIDSLSSPDDKTK